MHRPTVMARLTIGLAAVALLAGCGAQATSSPTVSPPSALTGAQPSASPAPFASLVASPMPSDSPVEPPSPAQDPTSSAPRSSDPTDSFAGRVVTTLADEGLRVRSRPGVGNDSFKEEPLVPLGTALYVLDGPVPASGYDWYEVVPLSSRSLPSGWVAGAGRDGEPWIEADAFDCPPVPTDFRSLAALPAGVGLACFPRVPITVRARLISCNCDVDGSWYTPFWFHLNDDPDLLVEPGRTTVPRDMGDWFGLNLDPAGKHPRDLPEGKVVEVTGVFDHPAAARCTRTEMDGQPVPSQGCRLEFAVTRLVVDRP